MTAPTIEEAKAVLIGRSVREMSSSRHVYLAESGWVYKFESEGDEYWTPQEQNREEWATYLFLRENMDLLPEGTAIPELVLLEDESFLGGCVIASRYVEVEDCVPDCYERYNGEWVCLCVQKPECWWKHMGYGSADGKMEEDRLLVDLWGNVFYDKHGTYWLLDLGYGSERLKELMSERRLPIHA